MAKETFDRSKPHVNIGTVSQIVTDTSGQLTLSGNGSETQGSPAPSTQLFFSAPGSGSPQSYAVAYPIDTDFVFDPATSGRAVSIDFAVDVLPTAVTGSNDIQVTLTILQDQFFVASGAGDFLTTGGAWVTADHIGLLASDFRAVDGGGALPDFGRSFQFGYAFLGDYSTQGLSIELGVDNMTVEITTVPEPMSIAVMLVLCGGALLCRRTLAQTAG